MELDNTSHTINDLAEAAARNAAERSNILATAVGQVAAAAEEAKVAKQHLEAAVFAARQVGATWQVIGGAAGMSHQSANQRWAKLVSKPETPGLAQSQ